MKPLSELRLEQIRLVRKLESIADLSDDDRRALLDLPVIVRDVDDNQTIVHDGDRPTSCCLILDGFTCRYKLLSDGKRQIMAFHTPGDIPDLQSLFLDVMDHNIGTLAPSRVAFIPHASVRAVIERHPGLAAALWKDTLIDAAIFREWMVGLGRRTAYQQIAHVLCELQMRLQAVGLTTGHSYQLPVTQAELADAQGLSTVHVNRVLKDMRRDGLISLRGDTVQILDWEGLKRAGDFDPTYLHLEWDKAA
jgi:CRP-like cAMP-binding protein